MNVVIIFIYIPLCLASFFFFLYLVDLPTLLHPAVYSLSLLHSIPLYGHNSMYSSRLLLLDTGLFCFVFFQLKAIRNKDAMNVLVLIFQCTSVCISAAIYLQVKLLGLEHVYA